MLRRNYNGAKRCAVRVVKPLIVNGYAKEPGGTEGFDAGVNFFEHATDGFFTFVNAKNHLRG